MFISLDWVRPRNNGILNMSGQAGNKSCWGGLLVTYWFWLVLDVVSSRQSFVFLGHLPSSFSFALICFPGLEVKFLSSSRYLLSHEETEAIHYSCVSSWSFFLMYQMWSSLKSRGGNYLLIDQNCPFCQPSNFRTFLCLDHWTKEEVSGEPVVTNIVLFA